MNRFFAFGCSFTKFVYPTYADLLSLNFDFYENWGRGGSGNHFIFNSVVEANQRHRFNAQDTIIVQWTNTGREDRYVDKSWIGDGNIYSQLTYNESWVKQFVCERGCLIRDFAFIKATQVLLAATGCNFKFISMVPLLKHDEWLDNNREKNHDVCSLYKDVLDLVRPSFFEIVYNNSWSTQMFHNGKHRDSHPSPNEHLEYIRKVLPEFDVTNLMTKFADNETNKFFNNLPSRWQHQNIKRL